MGRLFTRLVIILKDEPPGPIIIPAPNEVNGVDLFKWNKNNKFTEMKVMIRTEKALEAVKSEMTKHLMRPEIWR